MLRAVIELEYTECQFLLQLLDHALLVPNPETCVVEETSWFEA